MDLKYYKYVLERRMTGNNDLKLLRLQIRNQDLEWTILKAIELIKKGNSEKALKLLKKIIYEK